MKNLRLVKNTLVAIMVFSFLGVSCSDDDNNNPPASNTITDIVVNDPNFSLLEAAVTRAGLADALKGSNLTVFAPDNAAFAASLGISTEAEINAVPVSTLDSILKYHVLGSVVSSGSVPASDAVTTLLGTKLFASNNANGVFVNGIGVKTADVTASNGVIHVIESVLLPPTQTIAEIAAGNPQFSTLVEAVTKAGLLDAISGPGKLTVFAPTNDAFTAAGITDINAVDQATVETVVKYHVITTNVFSSDLINDATATTLQGGTLTIKTTPDASVIITGSSQSASNITFADIVATNGVIHVIDRTLLP